MFVGCIIKQFDIDIQMIVATSGTEKVRDSANVKREVVTFDDKLKCIALLKAVGIESQRVIESKGHNVCECDLMYAQALDVLKSHYGREESVNVKTRNIVCQTKYGGK